MERCDPQETPSSALSEYIEGVLAQRGTAALSPDSIDGHRLEYLEQSGGTPLGALEPADGDTWVISLRMRSVAA
jgi:hypothetical protein